MESINLLWMPAPVNREFRSATARRYGFPNTAAQRDRFIDRDELAEDEVKNPNAGTMNLKGEWDLPNYRAFEKELKKYALSTNEVSVAIRPSFVSTTGTIAADIIYADIYLNDFDQPLYRYNIDNIID